MMLHMLFLPPPPSELLSIQSVEENEFVLKYSPEVWKGTVNVWLGMYYDTNSKYHVTGALMKVEIQYYAASPLLKSKTEF